MPVLNLERLGPNKITALADSPPVCLGNITNVTLTAECTYTKKARRSIRVHVRASYDGVNYDTSDLTSFNNDFEPGKTARKTLELDTKVRFIKVLVENIDESEGVSDVRIMATLSG